MTGEKSTISIIMSVPRGFWYTPLDGETVWVDLSQEEQDSIRAGWEKIRNGE